MKRVRAGYPSLHLPEEWLTSQGYKIPGKFILTLQLLSRRFGNFKFYGVWILGDDSSLLDDNLFQIPFQQEGAEIGERSDRFSFTDVGVGEFDPVFNGRVMI